MLVIGSRNSSNSNRLVDVTRELGTASHLIDNADQVEEEWLDGRGDGRHHLRRERPRGAGRRRWSSSSASAVPDEVRELRTVDEDVRFMLPKEIRTELAARS